MKVGKTIIDGTILFAAVYAGVKGYKLGTKEFEKSVPAAIDKVHMVGLVANMASQSDDE